MWREGELLPERHLHRRGRTAHHFHWYPQWLLKSEYGTFKGKYLLNTTDMTKNKKTKKNLLYETFPNLSTKNANRQHSWLLPKCLDWIGLNDHQNPG